MVLYRPFQSGHKITHCASLSVMRKYDVCKWLTMVLGGPVGQTPPCGPDSLIEPFISCQPAAGYRFPTASSAAWVARQLESQAERKSRPDTASLEHYCSPTPHGRMKTHPLKMSDWTLGIPRALLLGQVPGKPFAVYHLRICYDWLAGKPSGSWYEQEGCLRKDRKFYPGRFLKRTILCCIVLELIYGHLETTSFRFDFISSSDQCIDTLICELCKAPVHKKVHKIFYFVNPAFLLRTDTLQSWAYILQFRGKQPELCDINSELKR